MWFGYSFSYEGLSHVLVVLETGVNTGLNISFKAERKKPREALWRWNTQNTHYEWHVWCTCGTALLPNIPLRIARQRPTMTSSLMFSMMPAASPAINARRIGAAKRCFITVVFLGGCQKQHTIILHRISKQQRESKTGSLLTFVEVPEEEELTPTRRGGADVTKQVDAGIPEHAVETQHHL